MELTWFYCFVCLFSGCALLHDTTCQSHRSKKNPYVLLKKSLFKEWMLQNNPIQNWMMPFHIVLWYEIPKVWLFTVPFKNSLIVCSKEGKQQYNLVHLNLFLKVVRVCVVRVALHSRIVAIKDCCIRLGHLFNSNSLFCRSANVF